MKYFRFSQETGEKQEISKEKALDILLTVYRDNDMTRDMLTIPNNIQCRFSWISVQDDSTPNPKCAMPGVWNLLPMGAEYDDNGKRITA